VFFALQDTAKVRSFVMDEGELRERSLKQESSLYEDEIKCGSR